MIATICFWLCVALIFHSYVLFPLLLRLIALFQQHRPEPEPPVEYPFVSLLIAAHNEEDVIEEKILSVCNGTYPVQRYEILLGLDGCTDRTLEITSALARAHANIRINNYPVREGKPNVINKLAAEASGSLLVFTDANVLFDEKTLEEIVSPFVDPRIGLVDTRMINLGLKREGISFQEKAYISREVGIKDLESRLWGTMMGPFGGCFAIRRSLFEPIPRNFLVDDFFLNMKVLESGFRAINNPAAQVFEDVSNDLAIEYRRKIRIATGNFQNLVRFRKLLFSSFPGLSFCFWSHKVLRWLGPLFLIAALVCLGILAFTSIFYGILFLVYVAILLAPVLDFTLKKLHLHISLVRFVTHFLAMNLSMLTGMVHYIKGVKSNVWQPTKRHQ